MSDNGRNSRDENDTGTPHDPLGESDLLSLANGLESAERDGDDSTTVKDGSKDPLTTASGPKGIPTKDTVMTTEDTEADEKDSAYKDKLRKCPNLTQKGTLHMIATMKNLIVTMSKRLDNQTAIIYPLLDSKNFDAVNNETITLDKIYQDIIDYHTRLCELFCNDDDGEEYTAACIAMDVTDSKFFKAKEDICKWMILRDSEAQEAAPSYARSGSGSANSVRSVSSQSSSNRSRRSKDSMHSKGSQLSNKSLKLKAKIEGLKAEAEAIRKTKEAELNATLLKKRARNQEN